MRCLPEKATHLISAAHWVDRSQRLGVLRVHWLVLACLVIEFECVIGVCEVLLVLFFDFPVGFDPIKKLCVVTHVFGHSSLMCFQGLCYAAFSLPKSVLAGQIFSKIVAASESSNVMETAPPIIIAILAIVYSNMLIF